MTAVKLKVIDGQTYQICDWSQRFLKSAYGIPKATGSGRDGRYADGACAVAHLMEKYRNGIITEEKLKTTLKRIAGDLGLDKIPEAQLHPAPKLDPTSDDYSYREAFKYMHKPSIYINAEADAQDKAILAERKKKQKQLEKNRSYLYKLPVLGTDPVTKTVLHCFDSTPLQSFKEPRIAFVQIQRLSKDDQKETTQSIIIYYDEESTEGKNEHLKHLCDVDLNGNVFITCPKKIKEFSIYDEKDEAREPRKRKKDENQDFLRSFQVSQSLQEEIFKIQLEEACRPDETPKIPRKRQRTH